MPTSRSRPGLPARPSAAALLLLTLLLALTGCASSPNGTASAAAADKAAIPAKIPPGTTLTIADPAVHVALKLSGQLGSLPFRAKWANMSGGPQCSEAFRAKAVDVCSAAEIPSINAHWNHLDTRLVAAVFRKDPLHHPVYRLGIAPGAHIRTLADLRGKRIAYSPGQAQGALVLRILKKAGLGRDDVKLVEMPSTGDTYPTALGSRQVDAAPLGGVNVKRFLDKYGKDGATTVEHGIRDDAGHLWAPVTTTADPAKAAALRAYIAAWARAQLWIDRHPKEWIAGYYVKDQGLSPADGAYLVGANGHPDIPASWDGAIARQQRTVDLLAAAQHHPVFRAATLFDRRFEHVAADAVKTPGGGAA